MVQSANDVHRRFVRLLHRDLDLGAFLDAADHELAGVLAFDSSCWLSLDPATVLPTAHFSREFGFDHLMQLAANEFLEDDVNKFAALAGADRPVGILSQATGGDLRRSARFVKVLAPHGYEAGDELRAVFTDGEAAWGCVVLHRRTGVFDDLEADRVASVGAHVAEGIRRAILRTALASDAGQGEPGVIVLRQDDSVETMTPAARRWLGETFDSTRPRTNVPLSVVSIASLARRAGAGSSDDVATARLPMRNGGWLRLDASLPEGTVAGRVAIIVHPVTAPEIAGLIVDAYRLSARERDVTRLVLQGRSTQEIATALGVSAYTVQDHLKSVFVKVGVRSRRELVAQLFVQQCAPRLSAGHGIAPDGWFADARPDVAGNGRQPGNGRH